MREILTYHALRITFLPMSIGVLNEKALHASLKAWLAQPGDLFEQPLDGFVIDIVRGEQLIEVQTRQVRAMRRKLDLLLAHHLVQLVLPIAVEKWVVKVDGNGRSLSRRKSPKRGSVYDLFAELVSVPTLLGNPNLTLTVLLIQEEEVRRFDGNRSWRRKGWAAVERRLVQVVGQQTLTSTADAAALLPDGCPVCFTTADVGQAAGISSRLAQQMVYCLRELGEIEVVGKNGRFVLYQRRAG
jgi:hypothetical protein